MAKGPVIAVVLCAVLTACNASGRPRNAPKITDPAPVALKANPATFGKVIDGDYVVAPGDTLAVVADRTNTPIRSLIDMNGLQPPYGLAPGTRLALQERAQYVAQPYDTVEGIAQRYGVTQSELVAVNNLKPPYVLQPGQRLSIPSQKEASNLPAVTAAAVPPPAPSGAVSSAPLPPPTVAAPTVTAPKATAPTVITVPSTTPSPAPKPVAPTVVETPAPKATESAALPAKPAAPQPSVPAAKPKTPEEADAETEAALAAVEAAKQAGPAAGSGKGPFVWPVQGKVIGTFGSSKEGLKNDGINIAAPAGAPVVAAADGTVAYAGNELRGFGNMVLLRHDGGYVTAYAHNASLLVKKGDKVKRGQTIARVGQTGAVFGPQLHFEIRKGTQPVDPMSFLSR